MYTVLYQTAKFKSANTTQPPYLILATISGYNNIMVIIQQYQHV